MAEENKPVEVPKEETPATITEAVAATETPAQPEIKTDETAAAAATEAATETPAAAEATTEAAKEEVKEEAKKDVVPIEAGSLEHKGSNFPKNFIYSKKFFFFSDEPVDVKKIPALIKDHHLAAWAAETGKGLLFVNEKNHENKTAPTSAIHLADASEPTTEGPTKFILSSKGHKHTFKAPTTADRDNWVAQLKQKIAEAKELSKTIVESEKYKSTLASFTPAAAVAKTEEKAEDKKAEEKKAEETPKAVEETPAEASTATAEAVATETPAEAAKDEAAKEEPAKEVKAEEGKRSSSKKRSSIFGSLLGKKDELLGKKEEKKEEKVEEATPAEEAATTSAAATETPAAATETPAVAEATSTEAAAEPAAEAAAVEPVAEVAETPAKVEKPVPSKRASIFSGLSFGKKPKSEEAAPAPPAKDTEVSETAPVIPKPDATEPLSTEVASPATVPTETTTTEAAPVVNGEKKPEIKSDKRKSSFPFAFGKKSEEAKEGEASTSPEAKEKANPFSKFRATIKGKGKAAEKGEEKPAEASKIDETAAEEAKPAEETKPVEDTPAAAAAEEASEPAKETPVTSAPVVTASA